MRLIDADAFDERVRVAGGMSEEELTEDFKDGVQAVLYMLSNQPTIHPEPHWIPVTERLPEEDGRYLVCGAKGGIYHANYRGRWWTQVGCGGKLVPSVVAWCELPEPYNGVTT